MQIRFKKCTNVFTVAGCVGERMAPKNVRGKETRELVDFSRNWINEAASLGSMVKYTNLLYLTFYIYPHIPT